MAFKVIGHRGLGPTHNLTRQQQKNIIFPENSIAAFREVLVKGGDGIEFDIALSKDNHAVVIHDEELFKHVAVSLQDKNRLLTTDYTLQELREFDIGHGQKIPTLNEVIELGLDHQGENGCFFNIDLKGEQTADVVYNVLQPYFSSGRLKYEDVLICSYDWELLRHLRSLDKSIQLAPCLKTKFLFGKDGMLPDYTPIVDYYTPEAMPVLEAFHQEIKCSAFDSVLIDVKDPLIDLAVKNNIGLMFSTGNNRVEADQTDYTKLNKLRQVAENIPFVIYKADDPLHVKQNIKALKK